MNGQDPQEIFMQLTTLLKQKEEQISIMQEQIGMIYENLESLNSAKKTVEGLKELKEDDEILVPIGSIGVVKAKIQDPHNFIVQVGADISIEKNAEDTIKYIDKNIESINSTRKLAESEFKKIMQEIQQLEQTKNTLLQQVSRQGIQK